MDADEVRALMESSRSQAEWDANCDRVKAVHGGEYPDFWFAAVIMSGLLGRVSQTWPKSPYLGSDGR